MGLREWFGAGRPKDPQVDDLVPEGVLHAEVAPGSVVFRNYRAPRTYVSWKKAAVRWTVVVTRSRLVVRHRGGTMVNVPWEDPRVHTLDVVADEMLTIHADASVFDDRASGTIEVRARCADPHATTDLIDRMRGVRPIG